MKSARKKKTMTKNVECLDPFVILPLELIVEILMKLPEKSTASLIFISKHWSSIIRSKDFIKLYMTKSSTRPRLVFLVAHIHNASQFIESCSQEDPASDRQRINITSQPNRHILRLSPLVRGLICRQNDPSVMIGNPSTGQFITLPRVKTRSIGLVSLFGYDPVNDVYKVLCMTVLHAYPRRGSPIMSDEHQVFTLGPKQKWRKIACNHPHLPPHATKGICINGIVYYYAWIKSEGSLICFDLTSEEFNVVKLPVDIEDLVNFSGKLALCKQLDSRLDLWVLQDAKKQEWSTVSHVVPSWTDLVGTQIFYFKGTLSTGQLIFSLPIFNSTNPYYFISYDPKENNAKKVVIEGIGEKLPAISLYWDHVESPMLLSKVS